MTVCPYCLKTDSGTRFRAREMMLGLREEFEYVECAECGSLRIIRSPDDLERFYPPGYYSFARIPESPVKRLLKRFRFEAAWTGEGWIGRLLVRFAGTPPVVTWLRPTGIERDGAILDVGAGEGDLLMQLHSLGFSNLTGVDPYIERERALADGVRLLKRELSDVQGRFDVLMFNHSLEHVSDPENELRVAVRLVEAGGHVVVRVPIAGTYAWRTYRENWVQLDSPRHLTVPTVEGLTAMAERCGLEVAEMFFESTEFQFWGSEQYLRDIPLNDDRSYRHGKSASPFDDATIANFSRRAEELNAARDGDCACFILTRS